MFVRLPKKKEESTRSNINGRTSIFTFYIELEGLVIPLKYIFGKYSRNSAARFEKRFNMQDFYTLPVLMGDLKILLIDKVKFNSSLYCKHDRT